MASKSFTLPGSTPECTVHLPHNLTQDQLTNFPAFKNWITALQHTLSLQNQKDHIFHSSPYCLREIDVQSADWFTSSKLGFLKLQVQITNANKEWLPGAVFLRGGSVAMLMILQPDDTAPNTEDEKHVLLTVQPRIAAASLAFAELPAGMLDDGTFAGKAAQEISEETGIQVSSSELINMSELAVPHQSSTPTPLWKKHNESHAANTEEHEQYFEEKLQNAMYPSPGGCDEFIPLFLYQKRLPREEIEAFKGKLTGLRHEGERITLKLVRLEDLWREGRRDAKALAALSLYEGLRREKLI